MQPNQDESTKPASADHTEQPDSSFPTLLLASLAAVLAAVVGLVAVALVPTTLMLVVSELIVFLGLVALTVLTGALLADEDG